MLNATDFRGVISTVFPSQNAEINISKQSVLAEHGREVRAAMSQLPPEVTRIVMGPYSEPRPSLFNATEAAIIQRELAVENAASEVNLDQSWLAGAQPRKMSETSLSSEDEWNLAP